jgi:hypothetical protein
MEGISMSNQSTLDDKVIGGSSGVGAASAVRIR